MKILEKFHLVNFLFFKIVKIELESTQIRINQNNKNFNGGIGDNFNVFQQDFSKNTIEMFKNKYPNIEEPPIGKKEPVGLIGATINLIGNIFSYIGTKIKETLFHVDKTEGTKIRREEKQNEFFYRYKYCHDILK